MTLDELFCNLGEIISTNQSGENVYDIYSTCIELFNSKIVTFKPEPQNNQLMKGMGVKKEGNNISILVSQKYIDTYRKDSSLHHTMLMHELKHLFDCRLDKDAFFNCTSKERHWFEFQARFIEVEFIKNYLIGKFNLTRLEDLLIKCYDNNDLEYFTILVQQISINTYRHFKDLENDYSANKISIDEIIGMILQDAHQLISEYIYIKDDYKRYAYYVIIKSFRNCLEDIVLKRSKEPDILFPIIHDKYFCHIESLYQKMYEIIDTYKERNNNYLLNLQYSLEMNYTELVNKPFHAQA